MSSIYLHIYSLQYIIVQSWKKLPAVPGNICDGWGTFWTNICCILQLVTFDKLFSSKSGQILQKVSKFVLKYPKNYFYVSYHVIQSRNLRHFGAFIFFYFAPFGETFLLLNSPGEQKCTFFNSVIVSRLCLFRIYNVHGQINC